MYSLCTVFAILILQTYCEPTILNIYKWRNILCTMFRHQNEDFEQMGHVFEYTKVDSSHLLMPQRRERVWGSSCASPPGSYSFDMKLTMQRLKSPTRFGLGEILEPGLPACDLPTNDGFKLQMDKVKKLCEERKLCFSKATFDTSTSRSRGPEWAHDMLTCVRPSHRVWLCGQSRYADCQEVLRSHGILAHEFCNPNIILNMDPNLAFDLAGNAFSTSALIAKILCTMVNGQPWKDLAMYSTTRSGVLHECAQQASKAAASSQEEPGVGEPQEPPKKKSKTAGSANSKKRKASDSGTKDGETPEGDPKDGPMDKNKQNRGHNKKGSLLTISKKMEILTQYETLKQNSKHPEKVVVLKKVLFIHVYPFIPNINVLIFYILCITTTT